jgi:hypothetical protein
VRGHVRVVGVYGRGNGMDYGGGEAAGSGWVNRNSIDQCGWVGYADYFTGAVNAAAAVALAALRCLGGG